MYFLSHNPKPVPHRIQAFTLVELLVVVAIIALLAAILFPVFEQAREKARSATCQTNLKNLGLAIQQYVQDNDDTMPSGTQGWTGTHMGGYGQGWAGEIYPYVRNSQAYQCPDDANVLELTPYVSYAYNSNLAQTGGYPNGCCTVKLNNQAEVLAHITRPERTVLLEEFQLESNGPAIDPTQSGEMNSPAANGGYQGRFVNYPAGYGSGPSYTYTGVYGTGLLDNMYARGCNTDNGCSPGNNSGPRHQAGSNYLAVDGHVKWLQGIQVSAGTDMGWWGSYPGYTNITSSGSQIYPPYTSNTPALAWGNGQTWAAEGASVTSSSNQLTFSAT